MKGNTAAITMRLMPTPDNNRQPRLDERRLFLDYLLPVKKPLYNFIRKTLNFSPDADDVFQETLLKGFRYFYSFDRRKSFKTWIFTIAHNLVKDVFGFRKTHPVSLEETGEIAVDNVPVSDDIHEIYTVASQLPPRHREVFFLYYYNGFNVSEIGEVTGLSRSNIKFILHRARSSIKKQMEVDL